VPHSLPWRAGLLAASAAAVLAAAPSAQAADAVFGGTTKTREPLVLKADKRVSALRSVIVGVEAQCSGGQFYPVWGEYPVAQAAPGFEADDNFMATRNKRGRFAGKVESTEPLSDGQANVSVDVAGRMTRSAARGTMSATVTIVNDAGQTVDTCTAPATSWAASRRPGIIYGGTSDQGEPVVVRLRADRSKVADFLFSWHADCSPDGAFRLQDGLRDFSVSHTGAFGDTSSDTVNTPNGDTGLFDYSLKGHVHRTAASGTVSAQITGRDAKGAQQMQCATGDVEWSATSG
jgi:hypothetical protein